MTRGIRYSSLSPYGLLIKQRILSAISKHKLKRNITVYRGINISDYVFENEFNWYYKRNILKTGSVICSTSRYIKRAINGSYGKNNVSIIFEIPLKKGYYALPVEDIAFDRNEREILISEPKYRITEISDFSYKRKIYKLIKIEIEE